MTDARTAGTADLVCDERLDPGSVLVLQLGFAKEENFFLEAIEKRGVSADVCLCPVSWKPMRAIRRLHLLSPLPGKKIWFGNWLGKVKAKQLIVIHAADLTVPVAKYVVRMNPEARVVFWFWNPVGRGTDPARARIPSLELWSFDKDDCLHYGMRFNTQFNFCDISDIGKAVAPEIDLGFFGVDKGRATVLSDLARQAGQLGLSYRFEVVPNRGNTLGQHPELSVVTPIPYKTLLERTAQARMVVDIVQEGQSGMTLRALESLYLRRKLLTNCVAVRDSMLYDPSRVFILGDDDIETLPIFLQREMSEPSQEVWEYYDFDEWINRFK